MQKAYIHQYVLLCMCLQTPWQLPTALWPVYLHHCSQMTQPLAPLSLYSDMQHRSTLPSSPPKLSYLYIHTYILNTYSHFIGTKGKTKDHKIIKLAPLNKLTSMSEATYLRVEHHAQQWQCLCSCK